MWKSVSHTHVSTRITGWHCRKLFLSQENNLPEYWNMPHMYRMCSACAENDASFQSVTCMLADYKFAFRRLRPALTWNWAFLLKSGEILHLSLLCLLIISWTPRFAITLRLTILDLPYSRPMVVKTGSRDPQACLRWLKVVPSTNGNINNIYIIITLIYN